MESSQHWITGKDQTTEGHNLAKAGNLWFSAAKFPTWNHRKVPQEWSEQIHRKRWIIAVAKTFSFAKKPPKQWEVHRWCSIWSFVQNLLVSWSQVTVPCVTSEEIVSEHRKRSSTVSWDQLKVPLASSKLKSFELSLWEVQTHQETRHELMWILRVYQKLRLHQIHCSAWKRNYTSETQLIPISQHIMSRSHHKTLHKSHWAFAT